MTAYPQFDVILKALNLSSVGVIITDPEQKDNPIILLTLVLKILPAMLKKKHLAPIVTFYKEMILTKKKLQKSVMPLTKNQLRMFY